jgi:hypothetical protein
MYYSPNPYNYRKPWIVAGRVGADAPDTSSSMLPAFLSNDPVVQLLQQEDAAPKGVSRAMLITAAVGTGAVGAYIGARKKGGVGGGIAGALLGGLLPLLSYDIYARVSSP